MMIYSCCLGLLIVSATLGLLHSDRPTGSHAPFPEAPCSAEGGICANTTDCLERTEVNGLCPKQQANGIECCRRLKPLNETSDGRGTTQPPSGLNENCGTVGSCMKANCSLVDPDGHCQKPLRCCVLVK